MKDKLVVRDLCKVFGPHPDEAVRLLDNGCSKEEIFRRTCTTVAVQHANFAIREGEVFVVMGLSGSGKSTLARMLNRLIEPTSGQILLDGEDVTAMGKKALIAMRRKKMSMVFQSFALLPHKTVAENTAFGLDICGNSRSHQRERALKALDTVGLQAVADSYPINDDWNYTEGSSTRRSSSRPWTGRAEPWLKIRSSSASRWETGSRPGSTGSRTTSPACWTAYLDGTITGIDPGAGLTHLSKKAIEDYGLDYELQISSGVGMMAALERAVRRNEWIVVTGWSPHWKFGAYDLRYLEDSIGVLGSFERVHAVTRQSFYQDDIKAAGFFSRMQIPIDDLQKAMYDAQETSYEDAVTRYIKNSGRRIDYWVTGEL